MTVSRAGDNETDNVGSETSLLRRGLAKIEDGDDSGGADLVMQYLADHPDSVLAYKTLGAARFRQGMYRAAASAYSQATALDPRAFESWMGQGAALRMAGELDAAAAAFGEAVVLQPDDLTCLYHLAVVCTELERIDQAERLLLRGIELYPEAAKLHDALSQVFIIRGQRDAAIDSARRALQANPLRTSTLIKLVDLDPDTEVLDLQSLENRLADNSLVAVDRRNIGFALGRLYHRRKEYRRAFHAYKTGNEAHAEIVEAAVGPYDRSRQEQTVSSIIDLYSREAVARLASRGSDQCGPDENRPIFVLGMTRSGTTLVEQILSRHPDVYCAGESIALAETRDEFEKLAVTDKGKLVGILPRPYVSKLVSGYLNALPDTAAGFLRTVDKNPHNFLLLGLIATLFPNAAIIHCRRDPIDTCLANYCQIFSPLHNYNNRLEDIGHYYKQYVRIMDHWHTFDLPGLFEVRYEQLVANPEQVVQRLLAHCGLDWQDECLSFYESDRAVLTPSQLQVRRPIYSSSVGKWRHYEEFLGALLDGPDAVVTPED